jgi:hypothetical protein
MTADPSAAQKLTSLVGEAKIKNAAPHGGGGTIQIVNPGAC